MNVFEEVKGVDIREAAARYGLEVKRGNMVCCPFHPDGKPSMKLYEDHFYCFGCHASGDVTDLTARLLGLRPIDAARRLREDFTLAPAMPRVKREKPEVECLRAVNQYIRLLCAWREQHRPIPGREPDPRFVEAMQMLAPMEELSDFLTYGPSQDREKEAQAMTQDHRLQWLKARVADNP